MCHDCDIRDTKDFIRERIGRKHFNEDWRISSSYIDKPGCICTRSNGKTYCIVANWKSEKYHIWNLKAFKMHDFWVSEGCSFCGSNTSIDFINTEWIKRFQRHINCEKNNILLINMSKTISKYENVLKEFKEFTERDTERDSTTDIKKRSRISTFFTNKNKKKEQIATFKMDIGFSKNSDDLSQETICQQKNEKSEIREENDGINNEIVGEKNDATKVVDSKQLEKKDEVEDSIYAQKNIFLHELQTRRKERISTPGFLNPVKCCIKCESKLCFEYGSEERREKFIELYTQMKKDGLEAKDHTEDLKREINSLKNRMKQQKTSEKLNMHFKD